MDAVSEIAWGAGLTALYCVVGWLVVMLISTARKVAVLEERTRNHGESLEGIGKLHARIDDLATGVATVCGQLSQIDRTLGLINGHLLAQEGE